MTSVALKQKGREQGQVRYRGAGMGGKKKNGLKAYRYELQQSVPFERERERERESERERSTRGREG